MTDRHDFIANFQTETYHIYCDDVWVDVITSGYWADLEDIFAAAKEKVMLELEKERNVATGYINVDKNEIMFWTCNVDRWWTHTIG